VEDPGNLAIEEDDREDDETLHRPCICLPGLPLKRFASATRNVPPTRAPEMPTADAAVSKANSR
jgi:hypothetical protein